ncbi:MAG: hypothetical protein WDO74_03330 [Pseudomonadota bacterium]
MRGERVVFVVANLDRLSVSLSLDEAQARGLMVGDRVELSREASAGVLGTGSVAEVEATSPRPLARSCGCALASTTELGGCALAKP